MGTIRILTPVSPYYPKYDKSILTSVVLTSETNLSNVINKGTLPTMILRNDNKLTFVRRINGVPFIDVYYHMIHD